MTFHLQMGTTECIYHVNFKIRQWSKTPKNQRVFLEDFCAVNLKMLMLRTLSGCKIPNKLSLLYYLLFSSHRQQTVTEIRALSWDTQTWQRGAVNRPEKKKKKKNDYIVCDYLRILNRAPGDLCACCATPVSFLRSRSCLSASDVVCECLVKSR